MEGIRPAKSFLRQLAGQLGDTRFTLIDIGCSGGIDEVWRIFGSRLRAFGFDPNLQDIERLNAAEAKHSGVEYIAAFVGPPPAAIDAMGDKARAKRKMVEAGVPCVPGYEGEDQTGKAFANAAAFGQRLPSRR